MKKKKPKILNNTSNLEAEIGHIALNAEVRGDVSDWLEECDGNIERCLILWVQRDTGNLRLFGTHLKCVEAIGLLEVAKSDLLDYMCASSDEESD